MTDDDYIPRKLRSCPFCGHSKNLILHSERDSLGKPSIFILCYCCGARGPEKESYRGLSEDHACDAVNSWNGRSDLEEPRVLKLSIGEVSRLLCPRVSCPCTPKEKSND